MASARLVYWAEREEASQVALESEKVRLNLVISPSMVAGLAAVEKFH